MMTLLIKQNIIFLNRELEHLFPHIHCVMAIKVLGLYYAIKIVSIIIVYYTIQVKYYI